MDELELSGVELFLMAKRLDEIRVKLFNNEDYKKLCASTMVFLDQDNKLFEMQSNIRDLAHFTNGDLY